ncbi:unnamed protein product [Triticum turgidum subsp. durum]|uniref:Bifunctional inhibitor/plant lipid transfer protein/seed storage helical domain-containing protein n=1 Tax=Triticum turgidum subsp. durum TaxID=4567 RepID=A0A9R0TCR6_TRITD|nr:unnamed protein product [Triticum turgidum subsp. durum]
MASRTSAACLLALLVASTFLAGDACNSCKHHTPPPASPSPPPPAPATPTPCPPPPSSGGTGYCPTDTLKLGACANVLGLVSAGVGTAPSGGGDKCCSLLGGLADLEAAVCLCTALKANVPKGFQCA